MLTLVLVALALCLALQPDPHRGQIAAVYVTATIGYDLLSVGLGGFWYFVGAALVDCGVVILLGAIRPHPLRTWLQGLSCVSIFGNLVGWVNYEGFLAPGVYTTMFLAIYALAIFGLLTGGLNVVGVRTIGRGAFSVCGNFGTSCNSLFTTFRKGES